MILDHYNAEEKLFVKQVLDYKNRVINNNRPILTKFLDIRRQEIISQVLGKNSGLNYDFYSPISDGNYKRCLISPFEIKQEDFKVCLLKIEYNPRYLTLNNRNILGNIMGMQIDRNVIGDIVISANKECYFACSNEMKKYLIDNLKVINHMPVTLIEMDNNEEIINDIDYEYKKVFVKSLRLDIVLSHVYNISRDISKDLISQKYVKINYKLIENTSQNIKTCDIIITRTKGKFQIEEIGGPNKSNNYIVNVKIYR